MNDLIEQFLNYLTTERFFSQRTVFAYRHDLNKFANFMKSENKTNVSALTKEDIRGFLSQCTKTNGAVTISRKLSSIKSFFKYLEQEQILEHNPASSIESPKIPEKEPSYLTQEEHQALTAAVKRVATPYYQFRDVAVVALLLGTGVRLSELVGLTTRNVSLNNGASVIKVVGKGNKERTIPLNTEVVTALEKYLQSRPEVSTDKLFVSRKGNGLSSGAVYHLVKTYISAAGIKKDKVGVHSLRHTFATSLLGNNRDIKQIMKLLGHKKLETTSRYLHVSDADLRSAVNSLVLKPQ